MKITVFLVQGLSITRSLLCGMAVGFHVHLGIALYGSILVLAIALLIYTLVRSIDFRCKLLCCCVIDCDGSELQVNGYETVKSIPSVFLYSLSAYLVGEHINNTYMHISGTRNPTHREHQRNTNEHNSANHPSGLQRDRGADRGRIRRFVRD